MKAAATYAGLRHRASTATGARVRALFAALVATLSALIVAGAWGDHLSWQRSVVVTVSLAVLAGHALVQYRGDGLPVVADAVPPLALLAIGLAYGDANQVGGIAFVVLISIAMYGSALRAGVRTTAMFAAYAVVAVVGRPVDATDVVVLAGALALTGTVMWNVGQVLRRYDETLRRDGILATAATELLSAGAHEAVHAVAMRAARDLVAGDLRARNLTLWRGDADRLWCSAADGELDDDVPVEVPLSLLDDELRESLFAGVPFVLSPTQAAAVRAALEVSVTVPVVLVAPMGAGERFGGAIVAAGEGEPRSESVAALDRLAKDVSLAYERLDSSILLEQVLESSSDATLRCDELLRIRYANAALTRVLGHRSDDVVGRELADLLTPGSDPRRVLREARASMLAGDPHVVTMRHRDGGKRRIELTAAEVPANRRRGWVVSLRDVTERERSAAALRASEKRFRRLAETVSEGLYQVMYDPEPRYVYVNPAMERLTGVDAAAFLEDPDLTLRHVHPDDLDAVLRTRTDPASVEWPLEVRWQHPDLGWRWQSLEETLLHGPNGAVVGAMGVFMDITAQKDTERSLRSALEHERQASEELRRLDAMKSTFLQAVSHELRTPLTVIMGLAHTLDSAAVRGRPELHNELVQRLTSNADRLHRLLIDLLDVDRLSNGAMALTRRDTDVVALVAHVVDGVGISSHPISFTGDPVHASIDGPKVERIVENLLRNAVRYTPEGTTIHIRIAEHPQGVLLTVDDEGPGIPQELRQRVFEPFEQVPGTGDPASPGTGIGLSLVARFAELHGGRAWVEESATGGAAFSVLLPSGEATSPSALTNAALRGSERAAD